MLTILREKQLSLFVLVMLITGSIDSIRNLPAAALFGSTLIFYFIMAAAIFLIPVALISAQLSAARKDKGGVYQWVNEAFGQKMGFLAIWLQWINTMVWYPTILSFIAATLAYLFNPQLAQNKLYLVAIILSVYWGLTLLSLKGIHATAKFAMICALIGMVVPVVLIISLAIGWVVTGKPLAIHLSSSSIFPHYNYTHSWSSLTAIIASYLGIELAAVHVKNIRNPQQVFPKAMLLSVIIILATMISGSLAIALVLPRHEIGLVNGVMQAFSSFFTVYHLSWLLPLITVMLLIGSIGGMMNWVISPAKGLLQAGQQGYLPKILLQENQYGVASKLLLLQAVAVSLVCLAFLYMPTINSSYWLLTDLSTQLYVLMYVIMFAAGIVLKMRHNSTKAVFAIPGGKMGTVLVCSLGLVGCVMTLIVGFFPPQGINVGGVSHYELIFTIGLGLMLFPILLFYRYKMRQSSLQPLV